MGHSNRSIGIMAEGLAFAYLRPWRHAGSKRHAPVMQRQPQCRGQWQMARRGMAGEGFVLGELYPFNAALIRIHGILASF